jgi:hypothetical protein
MSPTFIVSIRSLVCSEVATLKGPMSPAFAREGESDTSAASFSKLSPARSRRRITSVFSRASSSMPTLIRVPSPGTATEISRSVIVCGLVNSL